MAVVGYTGVGDTDDVTTGANGIIVGRGLVADLGGVGPYALYARIGHSSDGNWGAGTYDEAGNAINFNFGNFFGDVPIAAYEFLLPGTPHPGGDTYFYFFVQWQSNNGKFRYAGSVDEFFYYGNQVVYGDNPIDPFPTDNRSGTPCMWIATGPVPVYTFSSLPVISGSGEVGAALTVTSPGATWSNSPTSYLYQWYSNDILIPGATNSFYTPVIGELGTQVNCQVTAVNVNGPSTTPVGSNYILVIPSTGGAPVNLVLPVVSGASTVLGVTLVTDDGTWSGFPTSFTYQWKRDSGGGPVVIPGETDSSYTTQVADVGAAIYSEVTAYN